MWRFLLVITDDESRFFDFGTILSHSACVGVDYMIVGCKCDDPG